MGGSMANSAIGIQLVPSVIHGAAERSGKADFFQNAIQSLRSGQMLRKMIDPYRPVSEKEIGDVESRLGLRFPKSYVKFILEHNGGQPDPMFLRVLDGGIIGINCFFGIAADEPTLDLEKSALEFSRVLPMGVLSIADAGGGNYICLDLRSDGERIVYWDANASWGTWGSGHWNERDLWFVAPHFGAFLELLSDIDIN
jgi:hypothetical protein